MLNPNLRPWVDHKQWAVERLGNWYRRAESGKWIVHCLSFKSGSFPAFCVMRWNITMRSLITKKWNRPPLRLQASSSWRQISDKERPTGIDRLNSDLIYFDINISERSNRYSGRERTIYQAGLKVIQLLWNFLSFEGIGSRFWFCDRCRQQDCISRNSSAADRLH